MADFQRSKCYAWEDIHIHRRAKSKTTFNGAQAAVDFIWQAEGLTHPPKIKAISKRASVTVAHANRMEITISEAGIQTTILLHEIAHSMTTDIVSGNNAQHNGRWVGVFMQLLSKYAGFDLNELMFTAKSAGVDFNFKGKVI